MQKRKLIDDAWWNYQTELSQTTSYDHFTTQLVVLEERFCSANFTNALTSEAPNSVFNRSETLLAVIFDDEGGDDFQYTITKGFYELPSVIESMRVSNTRYVHFVNESFPDFDIKVLNYRNTSIPLKPETGIAHVAMFRLMKLEGHYTFDMAQCVKYSMSMTDSTMFQFNRYCFDGTQFKCKLMNIQTTNYDQKQTEEEENQSKDPRAVCNDENDMNICNS